MVTTIYLSGNITSDPETHRWRKLAAELLRPDYLVIDPTANRFNQDLLQEFHGMIEEFKSAAIERSQHLLLAKDYNLVVGSDVILVNLVLYAPEKPFVGTLFELAWAWQLRKCVVAIVGEKNWYCQHPFITGTFSATVASVEEGCALIREFY